MRASSGGRLPRGHPAPPHAFRCDLAQPGHTADGAGGSRAGGARASWPHPRPAAGPARAGRATSAAADRRWRGAAATRLPISRAGRPRRGTLRELRSRPAGSVSLPARTARGAGRADSAASGRRGGSSRPGRSLDQRSPAPPGRSRARTRSGSLRALFPQRAGRRPSPTFPGGRGCRVRGASRSRVR